MSYQVSAPISTKVFRNGNSRALRIPSTTLPDIQPGDIVEVILRKKKQARAGWDQRFKTAVAKSSKVVSDQYGQLDNDWAISDGLDREEDWGFVDQG